ncbi:MAG: hypothetical protein OXC31_19980, partial [Spirochaetaceae bacterium]|nr:hypothetical protein [Spirochaetaceae bacterium]
SERLARSRAGRSVVWLLCGERLPQRLGLAILMVSHDPLIVSHDPEARSRVPWPVGELRDGRVRA